MLLAVDTGTTETGYCVMDGYKPLQFGKVDNNEMLSILETFCLGESEPVIVFEQFESYGMPIGKTTIEAITWNGRFIQVAHETRTEWHYITRKEEKLNLCGSMKANDATIHRALIDRFAQFDFKTGKGTKKNPDWFYGMAKDAWSAYAVGVTYEDTRRSTEL